MRSFSFRLQTKLKVSNIYEDMARDQLRVQQATRDTIADQLHSLNQQVSELEQSIRLMTSGTDIFTKMVMSREYLPVLKERKTGIIQELDQAEKKVDRARDNLMARARETNTLEKLKERDWSNYVYENMREEQKIIDEAAAAAFYRNRSLTAVG
ncbi:flagellar protein flij [hydrocarbon metagenome]|uniref:Flagellar protein flij n=1 Tax=hydrocarbon metagenome TaxID=938273 RepID=A0A0W8E4K8_9ZZZZ